MTSEKKIEKVLVVLNPDSVRTDTPFESTLVKRASSLARITGCDLELFHVCYDANLDSSLFATDAELQREREALTDQDATRLAEMAAGLKDQCVNVQYEACWGAPRTDAILRKISAAQPDIVMKQAREQSYFLGLTSSTDWELARRSPAHVWLVNTDVDEINNVLAAVGNKMGDPADVTTATDYGLLGMAGLVGETYGASVSAVNAYQIPPPLIAGSPDVGATLMPEKQQQKLRKQTERSHNAAVKALAKYFGFRRKNVHIREGHPNRVIPDVAEVVDADLIVMGANSIGRLERLFGSVTVEPVVAKSTCDVLIVRDSDEAAVPDDANDTILGTPNYDIEHAVVDPESTFESPQEVATASEISIGLRKRILQVWECDIRAKMNEENEGGPVRGVDVNVLGDIASAKDLLEMAGHDKSRSDSTRLGASLM